jgi:cytochrome c2
LLAPANSSALRLCYKRARMSPSRIALLVSTLALAACAVILPACSPEPPTTGPDLFRAWGCIQCHAVDGSGIQGLGPSLKGKSTHWTRESLTQYLRDPSGYAAKTPRLKEQGRNYMTPMPPVLTKDEAAVARVVDHVLTSLAATN